MGIYGWVDRASMSPSDMVYRVEISGWTRARGSPLSSIHRLTSDITKLSEWDDQCASSADRYHHSLAIGRMFGGIPQSFFDTYHQYFPKAKPVDQYTSRCDLYELYHYLNHTVLFGVRLFIPSKIRVFMTGRADTQQVQLGKWINCWQRCKACYTVFMSEPSTKYVQIISLPAVAVFYSADTPYLAFRWRLFYSVYWCNSTSAYTYHESRYLS